MPLIFPRVSELFSGQTDFLFVVALVWLGAAGIALCVYFAMLCHHWSFLRGLRRHTSALCATSTGNESETSEVTKSLPYLERLALGFVDLCFTTPPSGGSKRILHSITGCVLPGELVALMGPSGSGKSTCGEVQNQLPRAHHACVWNLALDLPSGHNASALPLPRVHSHPARCARWPSTRLWYLRLNLCEWHPSLEQGGDEPLPIAIGLHAPTGGHLLPDAHRSRESRLRRRPAPRCAHE